MTLTPSALDQPTVCVLCSHNCGLRVDVEDNRIVAVRADDRNPITQGYVCNKGFSVAHYAHHAQRVEHPLKRQPDGSFARIGWDQAVAEIGARLRALHDQHTGRSIGLVGVGGQANHIGGPFALMLLRGLGSRWWFNALAQEKTQHALVDKWLFDAWPTSHFHADIDNSAYAVIIGSNPLLSNRGHRSKAFVKALKTDPDRTLVVVDPRRSETASRADVHLSVRPGGDVYMLLAIAAILLAEDWIDHAFCDRHVDDLDGLRRELGALDVARLCDLAGLSVDAVRDVARGFAHAPSASIFVDLGLEQSRYSTLTAYLIRLIPALTGNLGNRGGMIWMGLFGAEGPSMDSAPPVAPESGIEGISMWSPIPAFSYNLVPEEVLADRPDRIRALIVENANPLLQAADTPAWREAVAALDLLVVLEPAMSETAQVADYVLPVPVGYEKWEYAGFPKAYPGVYAQIRPPVLEGPADALPEAEIYRRIAEAAGLVDPVPARLRWVGKAATSRRWVPGALAAMAGWAFARGRSLDRGLARMLFGMYDTVGQALPDPSLTFLWFTCFTYAGAQRADLVRAHPERAATWNPVVQGAWLFDQLVANPHGFHVGDVDTTDRLAAINRRPDGRIRLNVPELFAEMREALAAGHASDPAFPFILDGGLRTHWNANSVQRDPAWRRGKGPHCALWMNPDDAGALGVAAGDRVRVTSVTGAVELPAKVHRSVRRGHVHIPNGFGQRYPDAQGTLREQGVNVNALTSAAARDRFTGCPTHKYVPVRVEAVG